MSDIKGIKTSLWYSTFTNKCLVKSEMCFSTSVLCYIVLHDLHFIGRINKTPTRTTWNLHTKSYYKILDFLWFSVHIFVTQSVFSHVGQCLVTFCNTCNLMPILSVSMCFLTAFMLWLFLFPGWCNVP